MSRLEQLLPAIVFLWNMGLFSVFLAITKVQRQFYWGNCRKDRSDSMYACDIPAGWTKVGRRTALHKDLITTMIHSLPRSPAPLRAVSWPLIILALATLGLLGCPEADPVNECIADSDCFEGYVCDALSKTCLRECTDDNDCLVSQNCETSTSHHASSGVCLHDDGTGGGDSATGGDPATGGD